MNVNWQVVGELARRLAVKAGKLYVIFSLYLYFMACVVAHGPLSINNYVEFVDHACKWKPGMMEVNYGRENPVTTSDAREH
jgi:hypothetical protein